MAVLLDHYHLTLVEYGRLTDRQLVGLYGHARDKHGRLIFPSLPSADEWGDRYEPPKSMEQELAFLEEAHKAIPGGLSNYEEARATIRQRWESGQRQHGGHPRNTAGTN